MGETITVSDEPVKPKPTRRRSIKKTGSVTPDHIETWMTQIFAFTAMMRNRPYWAISHPELEVKPWAGSAADLINEYLPKDYLEKGIALNAGVAVVFGVGMMLFKRMEMDRQWDMQMRQMVAQAQPQPAHPQEVKRQPESPRPHPQEPAKMVHRRQPTSGGAAPTHPTEPLTGLGMVPGGLS